MLKTNKMNSIIELEERITVAYREEGGYFHARALEFDIVGTGKTKEEAFEDLKELFFEYVEEMVLAKEPVQFYFPAEKEEWNTPDKEVYSVSLELVLRSMAPKPPARIKTLSNIRPLLPQSVKSVNLRPLIYA